MALEVKNNPSWFSRRWFDLFLTSALLWLYVLLLHSIGFLREWSAMLALMASVLSVIFVRRRWLPKRGWLSHGSSSLLRAALHTICHIATVAFLLFGVVWTAATVIAFVSSSIAAQSRVDRRDLYDRELEGIRQQLTNLGNSPSLSIGEVTVACIREGKRFEGRDCFSEEEWARQQALKSSSRAESEHRARLMSETLQASARGVAGAKTRRRWEIASFGVAGVFLFVIGGLAERLGNLF